jgi:hypothetical protein
VDKPTKLCVYGTRFVASSTICQAALKALPSSLLFGGKELPHLRDNSVAILKWELGMTRTIEHDDPSARRCRTKPAASIPPCASRIPQGGRALRCPAYMRTRAREISPSATR